MSITPWRRPRSKSLPELIEPWWDELSSNDPPQVAQRSDCCVAVAAYRVVLPATGSRTRPVELLLCGHHYRCSREALRRSDAVVTDLANMVTDSPLAATNAT